jgi:flagellar motor switch protein FliM
MNQILSQDEVDALLKGLDSGEIETEKGAFEADVDYKSFDWNTQGRNLKGSMPILVVINSRFAERLKQALSGTLRRLVHVEAGQLEMIKFDEFQRSLPVPTSLHLFKIDPLRGIGMLAIESRLVFNLVEAFFGGSGVGSSKMEGRDFTPIEKKIVDKVVRVALATLSEAWSEVFAIQPEFIRSESNPLTLNAIPATEFLVAVRFEIELGKSAGSIILSIPYSSIQPIRDKLSGSYQAHDVDTDKLWVSAVHDEIKETEVEFSVELGQVHLTVKDFLNMKDGDILVLENDVRDKLVAHVEGIPKFLGSAGRSGKKKVFRIERGMIASGVS